MKKAYKSFRRRALCSILGIGGLSTDWFPPEFLNKIKIAEFEGGKYKLGADGEDNTEAELREIVKKMIIEKSGGDANKFKETLKELTSFTGDDGAVRAGVESLEKVSSKQLKFLYGKLKNEKNGVKK